MTSNPSGSLHEAGTADLRVSGRGIESTRPYPPRHAPRAGRGPRARLSESQPGCEKQKTFAPPLPPLFARKKPYIMLAPCCVLCACARLRLKLFTFTPAPRVCGLCATNTVETGPAVSAVSGVTVSAEALTTLHTSDTLCSVGSYAQRAAHGEGVL